MRGDRLKALRVAAGVTQIELAEQLNLGSKEIWRYENGESNPSADTVAKIAQYLHVSIDYLMGLSDDARPDLHNDDLTAKERIIINALRNGDRFEAIRVIASGE